MLQLGRLSYQFSCGAWRWKDRAQALGEQACNRCGRSSQSATVEFYHWQSKGGAQSEQGKGQAQSQKGSSKGESPGKGGPAGAKGGPKPPGKVNQSHQP